MAGNPEFQSLELSKIREEGYLVVNSDVNLVPTFADTHQVKGIFRKDDDPKYIIKSLYNDRMLEYITNFVNNRLEIRKKAFEPTIKRRYLYEHTTKEDNLYCIAITILCESVKSEQYNTVRAQFMRVKERLAEKGKFLPYGLDRYESIYEATVPSKEELRNLFSIINPLFLSLVDTTNLIHMCVDETIFQSDPDTGNKQRAVSEKELRNYNNLIEKGKQGNGWDKFISSLGLWPIINIKDKPHDGLFVTGLATKSSKTNKPYLLAMVPYLGEEQSNLEILKYFINMFPRNKEITLTLDARFSSFDNFFAITNEYHNVKLLQSMKSNSKPYLWNAVKLTTPFNHWKVLYNEREKFLISLKKLKKSNEGRNYLLLTNAFAPSKDVAAVDDVWNSKTLKTLSQLPIECLEVLAGNENYLNRNELIEQITRKKGNNDVAENIPKENPPVEIAKKVVTFTSEDSESDFIFSSDTEEDDLSVRYGYTPGDDDHYGYELNDDEDWKVGQLVSAMFHKDNEYYIGRIQEINPDGTYKIEFEDKDISLYVEKYNIRAHFFFDDEENNKNNNKNNNKSNNNSNNNSNDQYSSHYIRMLKVEELKQLLKKHSLSTTGNKEELLKRALDNLCPSEEISKENNIFLKKLLSEDRDGSGPHFVHYKSYFNAQDTSNRLWYRTFGGAKKGYTWTGQLYWGMTRNIISNSWVSYSENNDSIDLLDFRRLWAESIMPSSHVKKRKVNIKPAQYKNKKQRVGP